MDYGDSNYTDHAIVMTQLRKSFEEVYGSPIDPFNDSFLDSIATIMVEVNLSVVDAYQKLMTACADPNPYIWSEGVPGGLGLIEEYITIESDPKPEVSDKERIWQAVMDLSRV